MDLIKYIYSFIFSEWYFSFLFLFVFFSAMYVIGVITSKALIKYLLNKGEVYEIQHAKKKNQEQNEIRNSFLSIFIFSLQAIPMQWLVKNGFIEISFQWRWVILLQIPILFLWNEIHFYLIHWLLHQKLLFRKVHYIHHKSKEPTVYSIYSFHWIEAFLLGTVIFFPLLLFKFNIIAIFSLPLMSIVLNLLGHCNCEPKHFKKSQHFLRFTYRHTMHHKHSKGNYGFMLNIFDKIFNTELPKNKV